MKVEIDGLQVEVNQERAADWHAFNLIRKAGNASQMEQLDIMFDFVSYVTDQDEGSIISHCCVCKSANQLLFGLAEFRLYCP